jgi:hypothetical protein
MSGEYKGVQENTIRAIYFLQFVWIVVFAIIINTDGDCTQPIRLFIKVLMYFFIVNVLIAIASCTITLPAVVYYSQALIHLFEFIWYIIGTVWFFKDDTCETDWYSGYIVALILVIFFLCSLIPYLCIFCLVGATLVKKFRS